MRDFLVYLAGPISGLTYDGAQDWRDYVTGLFPQEIRAISPLRAKAQRLSRVGIIKDGYEDNPLTATPGITTRDRFDCTRADAVLFNFIGAKTVSIGTCMELGWADAARNPIVLAMEESGNVHEHPMVRGVTGFRVTSLEDSVKVLEAILMPEGKGTSRTITSPKGQVYGMYKCQPMKGQLNTCIHGLYLWACDGEIDFGKIHEKEV